jgi:hypothetical protein
MTDNRAALIEAYNCLRGALAASVDEPALLTRAYLSMFGQDLPGIASDLYAGVCGALLSSEKLDKGRIKDRISAVDAILTKLKEIKE